MKHAVFQLGLQTLGFAYFTVKKWFGKSCFEFTCEASVRGFLIGMTFEEVRNIINLNGLNSSPNIELRPPGVELSCGTFIWFENDRTVSIRGLEANIDGKWIHSECDYLRSLWALKRLPVVHSIMTKGQKRLFSWRFPGNTGVVIDFSECGYIKEIRLYDNIGRLKHFISSEWVGARVCKF